MGPCQLLMIVVVELNRRQSGGNKYISGWLRSRPVCSVNVGFIYSHQYQESIVYLIECSCIQAERSSRRALDKQEIWMLQIFVTFL